MLRRTGACILILGLAGHSSLPADGADRAPTPVSELSDQLLRLHERTGGRADLDLLSPEAVELLNELTRADEERPPAAPSTWILLRELRRLAERVDELEAELRALGDQRQSEPLVRIKVTRGD